MGPSRHSADLIILARLCHTLMPTPRRAAGVAVRGGRIVGLGSRRAVMALRGRETEVVELHDAVVTPGLVDSHTHFFYWALGRALVIDVSAARTLAGALDVIRREARQRRIGEWIVGRGFDQNLWGQNFPTAADLDRAIDDRPAIIRSRDGHSAWLNTRGMAAAGITAATADPAGGRFLRDQRGRPTGIAQETALERLPNPLYDFAARRDVAAARVIDAALAEAYAAAWSVGITGVHSMDDAPSLHHFQRQHTIRRAAAGETGGAPRTSGRAQRAGRAARQSAAMLGIRVVHAIPLAALDQAAGFGLRSGLGDEWLRLGAVKIFSDGALGSQTALMFDDYPGRAGYAGVPVIAGDELKQAVRRATDRGWPCWIHAIGDRAAHETIAALAASPPPGPMPHRIEHAQCVRPADVRRMARVGIVASMQPCHILGDIATADRHWPRARRDAYALRRMLRAGVSLAFGSDVPIESIDPRRSFFAATMRTDEDGAPAGGWFPAERLTAAEVLDGFTIGAARSVAAAAPAGTLTPGGLADMTIWGVDPLRLAPRDLLHAPILGCIVGGEVHLTAAS